MQGVEFCRNRDKHPELQAEIQDLKKVVKELKKKQEKAKSDFDVFKAAREGAASSFSWRGEAATEEAEPHQICGQKCPR